jgi:hypothetical protein
VLEASQQGSKFECLRLASSVRLMGNVGSVHMKLYAEVLSASARGEHLCRFEAFS